MISSLCDEMETLGTTAMAMQNTQRDIVRVLQAINPLFDLQAPSVSKKDAEIVCRADPDKQLADLQETVSSKLHTLRRKK